MASEIEKKMIEKKMYYDARDRAIERKVEFQDLRRESVKAYLDGIEASDSSITSYVEVYSEEFQPETNFTFGFLCGILTRLEAVKAKSYRSSWMKNGFLGIFENIRRKFDRVEISMTSVVPEQHPCIEDLGDMAVYCLKEINRRAVLNPEEFHNWIKGIRELK
jgi:hypothetical protein